MANGDLRLLDRAAIEALLLDAQRVSSDGVWVEVGPYRFKTFSVESLESGATVEIRGFNTVVTPTDSNTDAATQDYNPKPAAGTDGVLLLTLSFPSDLGGVNLDAWKYIKARKIAGAGVAPTTVTMYAARGT